MEMNTNFDRNRYLNFDFFVESLSLYVQSFVKRSSHFSKKFIEDFQKSELFNTISDKFDEYPPLKFLVFSAALSCAVPIILFIAFGVTSAIIMFTGFLFVEGTLLAVGGLCLFICILTMMSFLSMLGLLLGVLCMVALKLKEILKSLPRHSNTVLNIPSELAEEPGT